MIVDAHIYLWTSEDMRPAADSSRGYIEVREVEQLLEEAHARGKREGEEMAAERDRRHD